MSVVEIAVRPFLPYPAGRWVVDRAKRKGGGGEVFERMGEGGGSKGEGPDGFH